MQVKYYINCLETKLKQTYPQMNAEFYYSRRKKLVHLALNKSIEEYPNYKDFLKEIEFFLRNILKKILNFVNQ